MKGVVETKMKMELNILHKIRYHDFPEMNKRKSELLFALKNMCVCLEIENYDIPKSIIWDKLDNMFFRALFFKKFCRKTLLI